MMTLLICKLSHSVHKLEGLAKVGKPECLGEVVLLDNVPSVHLLLQRHKFLTFERWHASSARNAAFIG
jgi:hypothetical protein